tara:strand:+ start:5793 stop:6704 length:912 start_codon:yes stop_codon:yes gene_type:complete
MKTVKVFYAGIPSKNNNPEKIDVLRYFHMGVPNGQSVEIKEPKHYECDLAVMQGWVHQNSGHTPHLLFRREIIRKQKLAGKNVLAIDSNLFLWRDPNNTHHYLRFSLNDVFPTTGNYFTDNIDPKRWQKIKSDLNIEVKPWVTSGKHILICLQRNGGWSMGGLPVMQWLNNTIAKLQRHTDRKIIVRAHPGDKRAKEYLRVTQPGVRITTNPSIIQDLFKCHAVVTFNSSPGVAAAVEGVPIFVTDPNPKMSQAYDVANTDLANINDPKTFERQKWLEKISMCHFNYDDLRDGTAWNIIKDYI